MPSTHPDCCLVRGLQSAGLDSRLLQSLPEMDSSGWHGAHCDPPWLTALQLVIVHGDDSMFWEGGVNRSIQVRHALSVEDARHDDI